MIPIGAVILMVIGAYLLGGGAVRNHLRKDEKMFLIGMGLALTLAGLMLSFVVGAARGSNGVLW